MPSAAMLPSASTPPQPAYVFRGHEAAIHSVAFLRKNLRLLSGDAEGWLVLWSLLTKRPAAVWKGHEASILKAEGWGDDDIITQGRDGKLCVWSLKESDEETMSTRLPAEHSDSHPKQPWLLHSLSVSSLNFCAFSACNNSSEEAEAAKPKSLLVAVAGAAESAVDVYELPSEKQVASIPAPDEPAQKTGMVMAIAVFFDEAKELCVIAGYESGRVYVFKRVPEVGRWQTTFTSKSHSQPILSLDVSPARDVFVTSGADATIAKHVLGVADPDSAASKEVQTGHAGQQGLQIRSDGKILATAGWDGRGRVYSAKTLKELAVLKWHKQGCYALAFAQIRSMHTSNEAAKTESLSQELTIRGTSRTVGKTVGDVREENAQSTHWLALGSKDGKISIWDIY